MELYLTTGPHGLAWLAVLLTYSLHAALWAGAVALLVRWRSVSGAARHAAWRLALLAPLVTTGVTFSAPSSLERVLGSTAHLPQIALPLLGEKRAAYDFSGVCLLLGAALGVARFGALALVQGRRLGPRRPVRDARLLSRLARLVEPLALGDVRLTESVNIDSPLVLGAREICVPLATLSVLDDAEVDAVLAHELAHVERKDALWFPLFGLVQAALWFHPVTRWVGVRLRHSAELACDERCLELTGQPLALARALTHIAAQALTTERAVALPTMTQPRSSLVTRVAQLTSDASLVRPRSHGGWQSRTALGVGLAAVALLSLVSSVRIAQAKLAPALASPPVRLLELEQELRHAREMRAFLKASAASGE